MVFPLIVTASGRSHEGYVVIDSTVNNVSSGGVRITPDLEVEEIRTLAGEMTLKYAWCRLPRGGAKAGIRLSPDLSAEARRSALEDFGRAIGPLVRTGLYNPGMDLGCGPADLVAIYRGADVAIGPPTDTSAFTAITVANCLEAWAAIWEGAFPLRLGIEGFGSVAGHLVGRLPPERFRVVALSTLSGARARREGYGALELAGARREHGDDLVHHLPGEALPREALFGAEMDVFLPSARTRSLTPRAAEELRASAVIPIANAPYGENTLDVLARRGVPCLPGFVSNCGGVFASSLYDSGVAREEIDALFDDRYPRVIRRLFEGCRRRGEFPAFVMEGIAGRLAEARRVPAPPSILRSLRVRATRRMPRSFHGNRALGRCRESLAAMEAELEAYAAS